MKVARFHEGMMFDYEIDLEGVLLQPRVNGREKLDGATLSVECKLPRALGCQVPEKPFHAIFYIGSRGLA